MLNIPVYDKYNGEKKIALLDNSTIAFMHRLEQQGYCPEYLLEVYDVVFLPSWGFSRDLSLPYCKSIRIAFGYLYEIYAS